MDRGDKDVLRRSVVTKLEIWECIYILPATNRNGAILSPKHNDALTFLYVQSQPTAFATGQEKRSNPDSE